MADNFSFKFSKQAQTVFKKLGDKNLIRLKDAYKEIGFKFRGHLRGFFDTNRGNLRYWQDLSPETKESKMRDVGFAYPSLVKYGGMAGSFVTEGDPDNITKVTDKFASFGSKSAIAKFHQLGNKKLPKREIINDPFVKNMAEKERFDRPLSAALTKLMKRAGFTGDADLTGKIFG
jgi:hypothetical protein